MNKVSHGNCIGGKGVLWCKRIQASPPRLRGKMTARTITKDAVLGEDG